MHQFTRKVLVSPLRFSGIISGLRRFVLEEPCSSLLNPVPAKAWKEEYQGNSGRLLVDALHAMNKKRSSTEYNNFIPIIQSSGMGKSRTVDEAAKIVFTLPFNLRSDGDATGEIF